MKLQQFNPAENLALDLQHLMQHTFSRPNSTLSEPEAVLLKALKDTFSGCVRILCVCVSLGSYILVLHYCPNEVKGAVQEVLG